MSTNHHPESGDGPLERPVAAEGIAELVRLYDATPSISEAGMESTEGPSGADVAVML